MFFLLISMLTAHFGVEYIKLKLPPIFSRSLGCSKTVLMCDLLDLTDTSNLQKTSYKCSKFIKQQNLNNLISSFSLLIRIPIFIHALLLAIKKHVQWFRVNPRTSLTCVKVHHKILSGVKVYPRNLFLCSCFRWGIQY